MANEEERQPAAAGRPAGEPTDSSLLRRLRDGNQDAATRLYLRYADRLRLLARTECSPDLARRIDADDIVQSVFASFFQGFNRGLYDVPAGEELWKLFLVIALNKIRAKGVFHRAAKRDVRLTAGESFLHQYSKSEHDPDNTAYTFLQMVIDETLDQLPAQQKQMVVLRIEGHEVAEIADKIGRSKRTVERVLQEFRKKLADVLQEES